MASPSRSRLLNPVNLLSGFGIVSHRRTASNNHGTLAESQDQSHASPSGAGSDNSLSSTTPLSSSVQPTLSPLPNSPSSSSSSSSMSPALGHHHHHHHKNSTSRPSSVGGPTSGAFSSDGAAAPSGESHRLLNAHGNSSSDPRMGISGSGAALTVSAGDSLTEPSAAAAAATTTTTTTTTAATTAAVVTADPGEVVERGSSRSSLAQSPSSWSDQQPLARHHHVHHDHDQDHQMQEGIADAAQAAAAGQQPPEVTSRPTSPSTTKRHGRSSSRKQTLLTKALLTYLKVFRILQPLVSLGTLGTMLPVLLYFRTQTIFPAIQASLYLYTVTLACASFLFAVIYLIDVLYHKPLFWPFTNKHFRQSSKARIGGDLMICMAFCGMWFLSLVGLVIDAAMVDCQKLSSLDHVFVVDADGRGSYRLDTAGIDRFHRVCKLEKASMGLAVICWACWMGALLVLLYGHFWKRRQVIAERLRRSLGRRHARQSRQEQQAQQRQQQSLPGGELDARGKSGSIHSHHLPVSRVVPPPPVASSGGGGGGESSAGVGGSNPGPYDTQRTFESDHCACQHEEGEVGLTGIICHYDGDSLRERSVRNT